MFHENTLLHYQNWENKIPKMYFGIDNQEMYFVWNVLTIKYNIVSDMLA